MKRKHHSCGVLKFAVLVLVFVAAPIGLLAETSVTFELIGERWGHFSNPAVGVGGASADGSVVVGWYREASPGEGTEAFRWANGEMRFLGDLPGGELGSRANAVSADGSVVVGIGASGLGEEAFRWENGTMTGLGVLPGTTESRANAASADGLVIVGTSGSYPIEEAFRWENGTMTGLGVLPGAEWSRANGVSADGSVVVGESGNVAFRWENGVMTALGDLPGGAFDSSANAVSADGSVVVGMSVSESGPEAFRWENGIMIGLGTLPWSGEDDHFTSSSFALAVSADGSVVVGVNTGSQHSISWWGGEAVAWFEHGGWEIVSLIDYIDSEGVDRNDFVLGPATAVSSDGTTIVGLGDPGWGDYQTYRVNLTNPTLDPLIGGRSAGGLDRWYQSDWWGAYCTTLAPWLYHAEHGFLYRYPESTNESMYVYDEAMHAWCWTNEEAYPFIYAFNPPADNGGTDVEDAWLFYFEGSTEPRSFGVVTGASAGQTLFFDQLWGQY